jgi:hypothetical protein
MKIKFRPVQMTIGSMTLGLLLLLTGCRITDHSERDGEVSTEHLNFPVTGEGAIDPDDLPRIAFDSTHADMGRIVQGAKVDRTFTFTNTGGSALVITDVRGSCGCTVGKDWPKDPVKPGDQGTISVTFDSEGRSGKQDKTVTVVANTTPPSHVLTLSGEVVGPSTNP